MIKKIKLKLSKSSVDEHLEHYLKGSYVDRLIWLTKLNKMARQLQKARLVK